MEAFEAKAKIDIPLEKVIIKEGEQITVTKIGEQHYLWGPHGIYTLDVEYIGEITRILNDNEHANLNEITNTD